MSLLHVRGLTKRFGGVVALWRCDLDVHPGEVHALIGPNGAGKTTLINLVSGAIAPTEGRILFEGRDVTGAPSHVRALLGIARTFQITNLFPRDTTLGNLALAVQARSGSSFRFWHPVHREVGLVEEARTFAHRLRLEDRLDVPALTLSHGEQRQLEVGVALASRPKLLLLDEPTSGMSQEETQRMVDLIHRLRKETTILLVEHDLDVVFRVADRVTVLVEGRVLASGSPDEVRANPEVHRAYLGEVASGRRPRDGPARGPIRRPLLLDVRELQTFYGPSQVLFGIDLRVPEGSVVTLLGRNGMGKTTTVRSIMGLVRPRAGRIVFRAQEITGLAPERIAALGIALVPEGRQIFPNLTVRENLLAFRANRSGRKDPWTPDHVLDLFPRLRERLNHLGGQLSGGEQQMLAIGRALVTNPHLLILDEATEGLAPALREEIWRCLGALSEAGQTILLIDKYVDRLVELAHYHFILERGRVVWEGPSEAFDPALWRRYLSV